MKCRQGLPRAKSGQKINSSQRGTDIFAIWPFPPSPHPLPSDSRFLISASSGPLHEVWRIKRPSERIQEVKGPEEVSRGSKYQSRTNITEHNSTGQKTEQKSRAVQK